jgi:hypothetical protein
MAARVLLGVFAALRAVLIPGQAELLTSQPLRWPGLNLQRPQLRRSLAVASGDRGEGADLLAVLERH